MHCRQHDALHCWPHTSHSRGRKRRDHRKRLRTRFRWKTRQLTLQCDLTGTRSQIISLTGHALTLQASFKTRTPSIPPPWTHGRHCSLFTDFFPIHTRPSPKSFFLTRELYAVTTNQLELTGELNPMYSPGLRHGKTLTAQVWSPAPRLKNSVTLGKLFSA